MTDLQHEVPQVHLPDRRLRLAFFGTPDIAATHLEVLLTQGRDDVVLVVSQPDRPRGRGRKLAPTPVKEVAEARGVEVLQPRKLRDGVLARRLTGSEIDLAVVVAYGRILPKELFEAPVHGTWNVHASLLPRHRGAGPIQHAILSGDTMTGVTLMVLSEGMDEGDMLWTRSLAIGAEETAGELFERVAELGAETLVEGLERARSPGLPRVAQDPDLATYAPMLTKEDGRLDPDQPAALLARRVRGLHPWPGTYLNTELGPLKVHKARVHPWGPEPGRLVETRPRLLLGTSRDALELIEIQPPGRNRMSADDFLRGSGRDWMPGRAIQN